MTWTQNYDPFGFWPISTIVAALPVLTLFFVLVALKKRVWVSAMWGMLMAVLLALLVFRMPAVMVGAAAARSDLRVSAHCVDHHRLDVSVQRRGRDRAVSGDEGFDRQSLLGHSGCN
jgi:hypothetical protein